MTHWMTKLTEPEQALVRAATRHVVDPAPLPGSNLLALIGKLGAMLEETQQELVAAQDELGLAHREVMAADDGHGR